MVDSSSFGLKKKKKKIFSHQLSNRLINTNPLIYGGLNAQKVGVSTKALTSNKTKYFVFYGAVDVLLL